MFLWNKFAEFVNIFRFIENKWLLFQLLLERKFFYTIQ